MAVSKHKKLPAGHKRKRGLETQATRTKAATNRSTSPEVQMETTKAPTPQAATPIASDGINVDYLDFDTLQPQDTALEPSSPRSSSHYTNDAFKQIEDPVFGGYIEEVAAIRRQSFDLQLQEQKPRARPEQLLFARISPDTWQGNRVAEQFRAFLGHDIGIRGPSLDGFDLEAVQGSIWSEQVHIPQQPALAACL